MDIFTRRDKIGESLSDLEGDPELLFPFLVEAGFSVPNKNKAKITTQANSFINLPEITQENEKDVIEKTNRIIDAINELCNNKS